MSKNESSSTQTAQAPPENVELVKAPSAEVGANQIDFSEDAGSGLEGIRGKDATIPFLAILQKGSPQVDKVSPKYIDGADQGMVINTATNELYPDGIRFIPCGFSPELVEWKDRDSGGGFVARHREGDPVIKQCTTDERGRYITPNGNTIIQTAYHFGLLLKPDGRLERAMIGMASSQLRASRNWNYLMINTLLPGSVRPYPSFSHVYALKTVGQSKDKYTWYGWEVSQEGKITDPTLYAFAKVFAKQVAEGSVQAGAPPSPDEAPEQSDKVPF